MAKSDLSKYDASYRANTELDSILRKPKTVDDAPRVSVEQAMAQPRVAKTDSSRNITRVLFISQDTSLLNPTKQSLDGFLNVSELFDEVHILILREGIEAKNPVLRPAANVWIYTASTRFWWKLSGVGINIAQEQLMFAAGFRPDLIVARDPFESALVAYNIAKKFDRPSQLHILEDYTTSDFARKNPHYFWHRLIAQYTLKKFRSVRVASDALMNRLSKQCATSDISVLPRFQDYESLIHTTASLDLKNTYRPFVFFLLFIGKLHHGSTLHRALDAARFVLKNPRVGMIILGAGPNKSAFERRTKILGIEEQVVFLPKVTDISAYLKSTNLIIVTDTDDEADEIILKAAAVGTPLLMSRTVKREDLFEDGVSAYLCEETDVQAFANRINDMLNSHTLRKIMSDQAQDMIKEKFHYNAKEYGEAYRASIEKAMFLESTKKISTT